jgi:hypothetical protein
MLLAAAQLAAGESSSDESVQTSEGRSSRSGSADHAPRSSPDHTETSNAAAEETISQHSWVLRHDAVRSRLGTFVLSRESILEHLRHTNGDVEAAVNNLKRAHEWRYTGSRGSPPAGPLLPDRVRNIPIQYFLTGEQERRQAADIFCLLITQLNVNRKPGTAIPLARSEAVLVLDAAGFDFEAALRLIQDREYVAQLLHIRFDELRTRSGTPQQQLEQTDAALAYFMTLTDRADLYTFELHLAAHGGDLVAAIADWQQNGVSPVRHPKDKGQTQLINWIGRRDMIQEDGHRIILRPMPTNSDAHEYRARRLTWKQEPHLFALVTTAVGAAQKEIILRDAAATRGNRPYSFIINHDRNALARGIANPSKFLIEYLEQGRYRSNGFDVINAGMKVRTGRYFWPGKGQVNADNKPVFDVNDSAHLKHFNNLYRQGYHRPTGVLGRDPAIDWSDTEMARLWELFAQHYEELAETAKGTTNAILPFNIPEAKKKEMATEIEKVESEERSSNSVITMAHRSRQLCKDFVLKFDVSNEVRRQGHAYRKMRQDQVDHVTRAIKQEGKSLAAEDILATLEQVSGSFTPFEWDTYMPIDAVPAPQQLPSSGLTAVSLVELRSKVDQTLAKVSASALDATAWEQAAQVVRYYYRSRKTAQEDNCVQPLLARMNMRTLDLQALTETEGVAIFEGLVRREQRKQARHSYEQLKDLVAESQQALSAGPASMPSGSQIDRDDVQSFAVGSAAGADGWLTDQAIEAGLQTLALNNTAVIDMHVARLHFSDPVHNPLPVIDTTAENVALIMHFGNHWTVGIYSQTTRQYHLLDSMPSGRQRFDMMAQQMDFVVAHYFPSHGQATRASSRSCQQENARDCGLYVIENIRSLDQGMPLCVANGVEIRMKILSEIMRLARSSLNRSPPTSRTDAADDTPSETNIIDLAPDYFDPEYFG